jgi:hypothetical protein
MVGGDPQPWRIEKAGYEGREKAGYEGRSCGACLMILSEVLDIASTECHTMYDL